MTEIEIFGPPGVEKKEGKDKTCEKFGDLNVQKPILPCDPCDAI